MELKQICTLTRKNLPFLLIVPYGIETEYFFYALSFIFLLIVPYGIETPGQMFCYQNGATFNRTLWN